VIVVTWRRFAVWDGRGLEGVLGKEEEGEGEEEITVGSKK
jgi:hypothetical protein